MAQQHKGTRRQPTDVDKLVGANVKRLRRARKVTQAQLGQDIGLSFKQVRKYESGENRISASALFHISRALNHPVEAFYDGLELIEGTEPDQDEEARMLADLFNAIEAPYQRRAFFQMVQEISESKLYA